MSEHPETPAGGVEVVVPADPTKPFTPTPLIADILRTRYCVPSSIFLVEGIDDNITITVRYRAVRLLLGDGEVCIQALLGGEMHGFVDSGMIYVGCYVRVDKFNLRYYNMDGQNGVPYLLVEDLAAVGWNSAYLEIVEAAELRRTQQDEAQVEETTREYQQQRDREQMDQNESDEAFEVMDVSQQRATQRRQEAEQSRDETTISQSKSLPWSSSDPTKPLKLTSLRSIPNLPYKQNWIVNVLAVVASLSDLEPSNLPPYSQRTARLVDPSTGKQVLLTVFLDPEAFVPKVGSVVLLVGLKNHRFDGGSLKKYDGDRPKNGARWWFEDPWSLDWCDVGSLKSWWTAKKPH